MVQVGPGQSARNCRVCCPDSSGLHTGSLRRPRCAARTGGTPYTRNPSLNHARFGLFPSTVRLPVRPVCRPRDCCLNIIIPLQLCNELGLFRRVPSSRTAARNWVCSAEKLAALFGRNLPPPPRAGCQLIHSGAADVTALQGGEDAARRPQKPRLPPRRARLPIRRRITQRPEKCSKNSGHSEKDCITKRPLRPALACLRPSVITQAHAPPPRPQPGRTLAGEAGLPRPTMKAGGGTGPEEDPETQRVGRARRSVDIAPPLCYSLAPRQAYARRKTPVASVLVLWTYVPAPSG